MGLIDKHLAYGDDIPQTQTEKDYYWKINRQQTCDDCISRQEALNVVHKYFEHYLQLNDDICLDGLRSLPSITPKEKIGHWILQPSNKEQDERDFIWWKCSKCGQVIFSETKKDRQEYHAYCGRCGAKMIEPQESEDKDANS